jgi:pimeloyl-ACP methyl ester carboxylesterase
MIKHINLGKVKLAYTSEGEGSDVLLLHGFPSNIFFWNDIKNDLIKSFRVTVVEQRGYPLSSIKNAHTTDFNIENLTIDIETLIEKLNLTNNLIIVGHDWGTIVAWSLVSRGKVKISKLISICGGTEFPPSKVYNNLIYENGLHYISSFQNPKHSNDLISNNLNLFFRSAYRITPKLTYKEIDLSMENLFIAKKNILNVHKVEIESLVKHFYNGLEQAIAWYSNIDLNIDLSAKWRRYIEIPVVFLFGENDAAVQLNKKMIQRLKLSGKNIRVKEVKNADHWLPITHKERVLDEIIGK